MRQVTRPHDRFLQEFRDLRRRRGFRRRLRLEFLLQHPQGVGNHHQILADAIVKIAPHPGFLPFAGIIDLRLETPRSLR